MDKDLKQFIQKYRDLIDEDTKSGWTRLYDLLNGSGRVGDFTSVMLGAGIDPAIKLGYIPHYFLDSSGLRSYSIPQTVTNIFAYAFVDCIYLDQIKIPNSIELIGPSIFSGCTSLYQIIYLGTKEEFEKIKKDGEWAKGSLIQKVVCTDGEILV